MFNINKYLERFKKLGESDGEFRGIVIQSIKELTGILIEKENIVYRNGVIFLKCAPVIKNTIFIKKQKIISLLSEKSNKKVLDIS